MEEGMARQAATEGLPYAVDRPAGNTLDLLRLVHLGAEHEIAWKYLHAMQAELFSGNTDAFEHATLVRLGKSLGIPGEQTREVLAGDRYADRVRADQDQAARLGARGVSFTGLGGRLGIPGAVSAEQYTNAINQAREQING
jgi:predicted DsbA family dithiol-disulfide isomerase